MTTTDTIPTIEREIAYDRETRDFRATLDGNLIGYFATYHDAENALDQIAYDLLADGAALSAAQLELTGPFAPLGECAICGCAAWTTSSDGLLCPDHANVWVEYHEEQASGATCPGTGLADCGTPVEKPGAFCTRCAGMLDRIFFETLADPPADPDPGPEPWPNIFRPVVAPRLLDEADAVLTAPATAERFSVTLRNRRACILCGGNHSAEHCPRIRCRNCDGPHAIQQCPAIRAALFAPCCPRCGGRHALADCPQRGPAETGGMLTSQGPLAERCRIEPADDNLEYLGFLDGVLVGIYSTVMTADLALANLAWASDHGLIARVQRCPGAAV